VRQGDKKRGGIVRRPFPRRQAPSQYPVYADGRRFL
jgi:hypothetical protein